MSNQIDEVIGDESPLWLREFETGLAPGWQEDNRLLYAECKGCGRAVYASNEPGTLEWKHYALAEFHKPEIPVPCFTPEPRFETVIGEQRQKPEEPDGIFQKRMDKQPESAQMLLFMMSAQDRFLFGKMVERLHKKKAFTEGEASLVKRMLLSLKSDYVMNEGGDEEVQDAKPNPEGVPEGDK